MFFLGRQRIIEKRQLLEKRKAELAKSLERLDAEKDDLKDNEKLLERSEQTHERLFHQLNRHKKELVADLFSIYPIEQVSRYFQKHKMQFSIFWLII